MFTNKWGLNGSVVYFGNGLDTRLLRGGPSIWTTGFWHNRYSIHSDRSKKLHFMAGYHFHIYNDKNSYSNETFASLTYRVSNPLQLSAYFSYWDIHDNFQYVGTQQVDDQNLYLLATLDRETLGVTLRADYAITPELTIQYYGNPYISIGEYCDYKKVVNPQARDLKDIYHWYNDSEISYNENENCYLVDENENLDTDYMIDNPNFNFRQYRSNLVARWEYKPGSALFLVWTHGRSEYEHISDFDISDNLNQLMQLHAENVFLLKFSYWFTI